MNITNPYAQVGWAGTGNSNRSAPIPSIFGALPSPFHSSPTANSIHRFEFTASNPDVQNCTVVGPQSKTYFQILNNTPSQNSTLIQNGDGASIALIQWAHSSGALVEVRDIIRRQLVAQWLPLSEDAKYRFMKARDRIMVWVPQDGNVGLYTYGTTTPELYAKISRSEGRLVLEMSSTAIRIGLLECCVAAAVLLRSGRFID